MSESRNRPPVDYDSVSPSYDERYTRSHWGGVETTLLDFVGAVPKRVLEVGCGTGHWVSKLTEVGHTAVGLDRSIGMLSKVPAPYPRARCLNGTAERLPFPDASFDRIYAINALHHFPDPIAFIREARRLLPKGGEILTVGLDPHSGLDLWCIYDYFAPTLELDKRRYTATGEIRSWLESAGFNGSKTSVALHMPVSMPALEFLAGGRLDKNSTSQLIILSQDEYEAGIEKIRDAAEVARARGETLMLSSDLRLYATRAWV